MFVKLEQRSKIKSNKTNAQYKQTLSVFFWRNNYQANSGTNKKKNDTLTHIHIYHIIIGLNWSNNEHKRQLHWK